MNDSIVASRFTTGNIVKGRDYQKEKLDKFLNLYHLKRFGSLIALELVDDKSDRRQKVKCACDCDNITVKSLVDLKRGTTSHCGCLLSRRKYKGHKLYKILDGMIERTRNPNCQAYSNYGGRGISVCSQWSNHWDSFVEWGIKNGYKEGLEIDRIDNDGNYEPSNCRFVTRIVNHQNRRVSRYCYWNDKVISFKEASLRLGRNENYMSGIEYRNNQRLLPKHIKIIPLQQTK